MERYKEANKAVKNEVRNAKERWINEKCEIIDNNLHGKTKRKPIILLTGLLKTRIETQQLSLKAGMGGYSLMLKMF